MNAFGLAIQLDPTSTQQSAPVLPAAYSTVLNSSQQFCWKWWDFWRSAGLS